MAGLCRRYQALHIGMVGNRKRLTVRVIPDTVSLTKHFLYCGTNVMDDRGIRQALLYHRIRHIVVGNNRHENPKYSPANE